MKKLLLVCMLAAASLAAGAQENGDPVYGTFDFKGYQREYYVYVPAVLDEARPLVFMLHGHSGHAKGYYKEFLATADKYGFAVCFPQGLVEPTEQKKTGWNVGYPFQKDWKVDDCAFILALSKKLQKQYGLDGRNVFFSGMSNGGEMCYLMAHRYPREFAAIASLAGLCMEWIYRDLTPACAVPFMEVHGTADKTSRWSGDPENKDGWGEYVAVPQAVGRMVSTNRCTHETVDTLPVVRNVVVRHHYAGGTDGKDVLLYEIIGGGHSRGEKDLALGEEMWAFFRRYLTVDDKAFSVKSPDGRLCVSMDAGIGTYDLSYDRKMLLKGAEARLVLSDGSIAAGPQARVVGRRNGVTEHIAAPFYRQAEFDYTYNSVTVDLGGGFGMEWRLSDDGAAYRFTTTRPGGTCVADEKGVFRFAEDWPVTVAKAANLSWNCSFEGFYNTQPLSQGGTDSLCFMPASVACTDALRVTLAESGVIDFPGSFLLPAEGEAAVRIVHAPVPGKDYIALSSGARTYPWRILKVTSRDADIAQDNLVYALAEPDATEGDHSWIKPGYAAWEWWNDWGLEGVDFTPGINDETYRAYIDFAAANGLEYVILDEGWGKRGPGQNLLVPIPGLHLQELADYAASKNVRLILWAVFDRLYKDADNVFATYEKMGIAGFKPDFFNRNDQEAVNRLCAVAAAAAKHHIFMDFHGAFPPMGLNRTYPNIVNMEGIAGLEQSKWLKPGTDFMKHDCTLCYLRTMAGVSDYTPGAMTNYGSIDSFVTDFSHPGSEGTRAHQVALYGIFDSPLTMLCDSPSAYVRNQETTDFISSLPRNYVEKKVIDGEMGRFIIIARKGDDGSWCLFSIGDYELRTVQVPLSFLPEGQWDASIFKDNVSGPAESYNIENRTVTNAETLTVDIAPGGGFAVRFTSKR